jgi:hypothetical protein
MQCSWPVAQIWNWNGNTTSTVGLGIERRNPFESGIHAGSHAVQRNVEPHDAGRQGES